jgi:dimethylhistidine N-methyltransferase
MKYIEFDIETANLLDDIAKGLRSHPKRIAPKYFYDNRGSKLFEEICKQPEYYPTRTETRILFENIEAIAKHISSDTMLIEFGSGSSAKTRILLENTELKNYMPVDISKEFLLEAAEELKRSCPDINVLPACVDFTKEWSIPHAMFPEQHRRFGFLPGSTLGNFDPIEATGILKSIHKILESPDGTPGKLLIGMDLAKDPEILEAAYNDAAGVTAAFNKNLIHRLQSEIGAEVDPDGFHHHAFYNVALGRIEMHLIAMKTLELKVANEVFTLEPGESIHTESSYKYTRKTFEMLCRRAGFEIQEYWTDPKEWFGVFLLGNSVPNMMDISTAC